MWFFNIIIKNHFDFDSGLVVIPKNKALTNVVLFTQESSFDDTSNNCLHNESF